MYIQPIEGGDAIQLTRSVDWLHDLDWTEDGREILIATGEYSFGFLMRVPLSGGKPAAIAVGNGVEALSVSRAGGRLVYSSTFRTHNVWRAPGPTSTEPVLPHKLISSTRDDYGPIYSPSGDQIAFVSDRSGAWEVWVADAEGGAPRQLTELGHAISPGWSPDGRRIVFSSATADWEDVFVIDAGGGTPRNLTDPEGGAIPSWSADREWIYYMDDRDSDTWRIRKTPVAGGPSVRLTDRLSFRPREGPDGRVFFNSGDQVWAVPTDGGKATPVLDLPAWQYCFWQQYVIYANRNDPDRQALEMLNLETGEVTELAVIYGESPWGWSGMSVSPDGQWVVYASLDSSGSDLMLVENFR